MVMELVEMTVTRGRLPEIQVQEPEGMGRIVMVEMMREMKKMKKTPLVSWKSKCYRQNIKPQKNGEERSWQRGAGRNYRKSEK